MRPIEIISRDFLILTLVAILVYYLLAPRAQIFWLLAVSWFFYATWNLWYVVVLFVFTIINFSVARQLEKSKSQLLYRFGIIINTSPLVALKLLTGPYGLHFLDGISSGLFTATLLPIGFSFYILQIISYLTDVYRGQIAAEKDMIQFALYLAYFPRMLAGPIERAGKFLPQLRRERVVDKTALEQSMYLILLGLLRKMVVADRLSTLRPADLFSRPENYISLQRLTGLLIFAFVIYNDFAGYTSIVRGVSLLFGIQLSENFRQPFFAGSFSDFWTRWHITLSEWLRDYIFYPLRRRSMQLQKHGWLALIIPSMLTMLVSGFWHGASLALLTWGFLHGLYLVAEQLLQQFNILKKDRLKGYLYSIFVFMMVTLAWIPFNTISVHAAGRYVAGLLQPYSKGLNPFILPDLFLLFFLSLWLDWQEKYHDDLSFPRQWSTSKQSWGIAVVILLLIIFGHTGKDLSHFVYQFF